MIGQKHIKKLLPKKLPKRTTLSSKIDGGKSLIIGGGKGLYGAGILSALACTRAGSGYTHLMSDLSAFPWLKFPDFILHPLKINELKNKSDFAIGIGPGLGLNARRISFIRYLIKNKFEFIVVDADALTLIAQFKIAPLPTSWILTPHEGELARLLGVDSKTIKNNRIDSLKKAVEKFQCTILLKGAETLILAPSLKKVAVVKSGTKALSKAGTGDVLLGIITAFRAQGLTSIDSAIAGAFIHGQASRLWEKKGNDYLSMRPTDLIDILPEAIYQIRNQ